MLIGLCADSHDNLPEIRKAIEIFRRAGVELVLHAGDVISPFSARLFAGMHCGVIAVFGNNDGEKAELPEILDICEGGRRVEAGGRTFFVIHDEQAVNESDLSDVDVLVFGHAHEVELNLEGRVQRINPGEISGYLSDTCSVAVYDTETGECKIAKW
ncbi:MAG: metallophosphoesterase [Planctomycetota bacterium]|nr:MAG: metallophosphoesterase [Planctomycetota bacterium]